MAWYYWNTTQSSSTATWNRWNNSTATTLANGSDDSWYIWNTATTTATTITNSTIWVGWNESITDALQPREIIQHAQTPEQQERERQYLAELAEQRARQARDWEARNRRLEEENRVLREKTEKAEARAKELLISLLDGKNRDLLRKHNHIIIRSQHGHHYRIKHGRAHNIHKLNEAGKPIEELCAHVAPIDVPNYDNMAAQMLMLKTNEDAFRQTANKWAVN